MYLFGAVNPLTGESSALLAATVNTQYMNHHLRFISEQVGPDVQVILVLDGAGWHLAKALEVPSNMTLLHLPPYSPELNPVDLLPSNCVRSVAPNGYRVRINHKPYQRVVQAGRRVAITP